VEADLNALSYEKQKLINIEFKGNECISSTIIVLLTGKT